MMVEPINMENLAVMSYTFLQHDADYRTIKTLSHASFVVRVVEDDLVSSFNFLQSEHTKVVLNLKNKNSRVICSHCFYRKMCKYQWQ